jgi:hypothetical protein
MCSNLRGSYRPPNGSRRPDMWWARRRLLGLPGGLFASEIVLRQSCYLITTSRRALVVPLVARTIAADSGNCRPALLVRMEATISRASQFAAAVITHHEPPTYCAVTEAMWKGTPVIEGRTAERGCAPRAIRGAPRRSRPPDHSTGSRISQRPATGRAQDLVAS